MDLRKLFGRGKKGAGRCAAVIVAAGQSSRMNGIEKILCPMGNVPLIAYTIRPFQECELVDEIVIVTREELMVTIGDLCSRQGFDKVARIVKGGATRTESVMAGLKETGKDVDLVAIHDGARPFVSLPVIEQAIQTARVRHAAAPAIPVKDTVKVAVDGVVTETPDREKLFAVQTPQVFEISLIKGATAKALEAEVPPTDDCAAVERIGFSVCLTQGDEENIKITTPLDLAIGEAILARREGL